MPNGIEVVEAKEKVGRFSIRRREEGLNSVLDTSLLCISIQGRQHKMELGTNEGELLNQTNRQKIVAPYP